MPIVIRDSFWLHVEQTGAIEGQQVIHTGPIL
jgi:hypothetical protein